MEQTKKTVIMLILIIIMLVFGLIFAILKITDEIKEQSIKTVYGIVDEVGDSYIILKSTDDKIEKLEIENTSFEEGDFIVVNYADSKVKDTQIIAKSNEISFEEKQEEITTSTTIEIKTTTKKIENEDEIVEFFSNSYSEIPKENNNELKNYIKKQFITIVDFIFYNGEINGVTWEKLSTSTKTKILYYALLINQKIENIWPNYKETIKEKYHNVKERLLAEYLNLTIKICEVKNSECELAKQNFNELKISLKITWSLIKEAFSYSYDKSTSYLKNWYEIFRSS